MFNWDFLVFLWILLAFACAGFSWTVGSWIASRLLNRG